MRSHTQSVVTEPNRRRITGSISYKPLISDLSVLRVCNKTGGTIKVNIKKSNIIPSAPFLAQYNQVSEEKSQMRRLFQVINVGETWMNIQTQYGFTRQEAKSLGIHLNVFILRAHFDEAIDVWAVYSTGCECLTLWVKLIVFEKLWEEAKNGHWEIFLCKQDH